MTSRDHLFRPIVRECLQGIPLALAFYGLLITVAVQPAQAQTFTILHLFTGAGDGGQPTAGLTMDEAGNLYGTASSGGYTAGQCTGGCGVVFKLTHKSSGWIFDPLYDFHGPDGNGPEARVIFGPDGTLYGTTILGGAESEGIVFRLAPPAHICAHVSCPWTETVLHSFGGAGDGEYPTPGDLTFDRAGNIYGTTQDGGSYGAGTVYELSPSNGGWTENILYSFQGSNGDGLSPTAGVIFDNAGDLYGTTFLGGFDDAGTVYELTRSASGWTETILHHFSAASGSYEPHGGLVFDSSGNLYGTTLDAGGGTAYELVPSNGSWTFNVLYAFSAATGSFASPTLDAEGNLYGTLNFAPQEVFRLTQSNGRWTLTGFNGAPGTFAEGNVILDAAGNLYTTASEGCGPGPGCVFEITP